MDDTQPGPLRPSGDHLSDEQVAELRAALDRLVEDPEWRGKVTVWPSRREV